MANDRWSYQVVEVKPSFLGSTREAAQERLQQLGLQGWNWYRPSSRSASHPFNSI